MTSIAARAVITPAGTVSPGVIDLDGERIGTVSPTSGPVPDRLIAAGFVDLQVNGHDDIDVATAEGADWDRIDGLLLAQGVTTWCPTVVTGPLAGYPAVLDRVEAAGRRPGPRPSIAGAHLEGPFLGGLRGAHDPRFVQEIDLNWLSSLPGVVSVVTLGAELQGAGEAIATLAGKGVLAAIGHSMATYEQALAAADRGARLVTHLFNAMSPLHHRQPGMVGAALSDARLVPSLIADLIHVHPAVIATAFRARADSGVALVTDAVGWRSGRIGGAGVARADGDAPRRPDGTIAGSALTMDAAVRNVVDSAGVPLEAALRAASATPAGLLGLEDRGAVEAGRRADLVALSGDLTPVATWVGGEQVWG
ncbi:MAG TPA: amidohydrolase family protein [Acidimicrobiales bacterium]|nr:amidohydrolase family protein [Acidimicrobiales bacterium]